MEVLLSGNANCPLQFKEINADDAWEAMDPQSLSANVTFCELLFNGVLVYPAVGHVKAEVGPLLRSRGGAAVGDGDGVPHSEVHSLHDALPLQLSSAADGHGGHVTAGADELLAVIVALLHVLQAPPDRHPELLRDLQSPKVLRNTRVRLTMKATLLFHDQTAFVNHFILPVMFDLVGTFRWSP